MLNILQNSVLAKVLGLVLLTALLCIPLARIGALIEERGQSQREAADELASTHAGPQTFIGPVLVVPYVERWTEAQLDEHGNLRSRVARSKRMTHLVFPEKLAMKGTLSPQERYRGIFRVLFYQLQATASGHFARFDPASIAHTEKDSTFELQAPVLALGLSDARGIVGAPQFTLAGEPQRFAQRIPHVADTSWLAQGIHAPMAGAAREAFDKRQPLPFELKIALVGQERLAIAPVAEETTAQLSSAWPHPSFGGRFLATQRTVSDSGFDARWNISSLSSSAAKQVTQSLAVREGRPPAAALDTFDVSLAQPLNVYSMSNRAIKYGALFVGLTLMAAFMFELFRQLRLHPVQYGLVGLSIALFFLLLLALSEKIDFGLAYAIAAGASVLLLGVYFTAVLRGWMRGAGLAGYVAVLYAALYALLASETNALLLGALLLFAMVGGLMIATRKVDWYALSAQPGLRGKVSEATAPPSDALPSSMRP
jgi:inner membrane protein